MAKLTKEEKRKKLAEHNAKLKALIKAKPTKPKAKKKGKRYGLTIKGKM